MKSGRYDIEREAKRVFMESFGIEEPQIKDTPFFEEKDSPLKVSPAKDMVYGHIYADTKPKQQILVLPKKITVEDVKDGVWQYLVDHSAFTYSGGLKVFFIAKSKEDFWKRCDARINKEYRRYDLEEVEKAWKKQPFVPTRTRKVQARFIKKEGSDMRYYMSRDLRISYIENSGTVYHKILLWVYIKLRNYLFPR